MTEIDFEKLIFENFKYLALFQFIKYKVFLEDINFADEI